MKLNRVAVACAALCVVSSAMAVPVTLVGTSFDVSFESAAVGLFGAPVIAGNQVRWFPSGSPGFTASSTSGFGLADATFALTVTAHPGFLIDSFALAEAGGYFFFGTDAMVAVGGQLRVTPSSGSTVSQAISAVTVFAPNPFLNFTSRDWSAAAGPIGIPGGSTGANVSVQDTLAAFVSQQAAGVARIGKTEIFLTVETHAVQSAVPEPETYAMLLSGLGLVGFLALRRRQRD